MPDIDKLISKHVPRLYNQIRSYSNRDITESEFRQPVEQLLSAFAEEADINLHQHDEYTLVTAGRADTVYNRLVIEYKRPGYLKSDKSARPNRDVINQIKAYIETISHEHRQKLARLAGIVFDGRWMIFISHVNEAWFEELPVPFTEDNLARLLKLLVKTSTGVALIPENLIEDFKGLQAQRAARAFYEALGDVSHADDLTGKLFLQWQTFFGEVTGYEEGSARLKDKKELRKFARDMGIDPDQADPPRLFFSIHTYFAILIKLIAWLTLSRYMPKAGPAFAELADLSGENLRLRLTHMERGGVFRDFQIRNFLEADFFGWYLSAWNPEIERQIRNIIKTLAQYDPETLEISPEQTRDLLKKLYHYLMPRELRHDLGEYYTPDWLAERLLNQVDTLLFQQLDTSKAITQTLAYARRELLRLRFLDPACGSGTFLVIIISRIRQLAKLLNLSDLDVLTALQRNVVGIDLNPLAAIASRTNFLLALGDLLTIPGRGVITVPIYLADSIVPPGPGRTLEDAGTFPIPTTAGRFRIPEVFGTRPRLDTLTQILDDAVDENLPVEAFLGIIRSRIDLPDEAWDNSERPLSRLYSQLLDLHQQGLNGVWARIIRNAFAPKFIGKFNYIVGNPPWVSWDFLPDDYRETTLPLWQHHNLFPHSGMDAILGKGKKDISMLMTYVAMDDYLEQNGKLGFVITQAVFKTSGAGQGFRKFTLGSKTPIRVTHVDDLTSVQPFEGASNRTSIFIANKGKPMTYPVPYTYWQKTTPGNRISFDLSLQDVTENIKFLPWIAEPVDDRDPTSAWITGYPAAIKAAKKIRGRSTYEAHLGVNSGGANAVYWIDVLKWNSDGTVLITNVTEGAKRQVNSVQAIIESDLVYPLLKETDTHKWYAEPSLHIILAQDPKLRCGIPEKIIRDQYSRTYTYFKQFQETLRSRAAYIRYFKDTDPFWSMFDVGEYTMAKYKVIWGRIGSRIEASVINQKDGKLVLLQETVTMIGLDSEEEAHYICSVMNSSLIDFTIQAYSERGGKSFGSPHVLDNVIVPTFDPDDSLHIQLANLSKDAHRLAWISKQPSVPDDERKLALDRLKDTESAINRLAAQLWDLTAEELKTIQDSLLELH